MAMRMNQDGAVLLLLTADSAPSCRQRCRLWIQNVLLQAWTSVQACPAFLQYENMHRHAETAEAGGLHSQDESWHETMCMTNEP